jgi:hypothetical protein
VGPVVALVAQAPRALAAHPPATPRAALLADTDLVLEAQVEPFDEAEEGGSSGLSGREGFILHQLGLEASEEAFRGALFQRSPFRLIEQSMPCLAPRPPPPRTAVAAVPRWSADEGLVLPIPAALQLVPVQTRASGEAQVSSPRAGPATAPAAWSAWCRNVGNGAQ